MIKVEFHLGYNSKQRPVAFQFCDRKYKIKEVVDRWYGEGAIYFKVEADDDNIYLLKYKECQDSWDLIFYQNPLLLETLSGGYEEVSLVERLRFKPFTGKTNIALHLH